MNYSERYIRQSGNADVEKSSGLAIVAKGRAFRPSTVSGHPIISGTPSKHLLPSSESNSALLVSSSVTVMDLAVSLLEWAVAS
jgi:hypothetical protein